MKKPPRKIIMITDPGIDDALSLFFGIKHNQISIEGVIATYGNHHATITYRNAHQIIDMLHSKTSLAIGVKKPLKTNYQPDTFIHGRDGLGLHATNKIHLNKLSSTNLMKKCSAKTTLISLAPLTEIAKLHQQGLLNHIDKIFIMGGSIYYPGNANPYSEANFYLDPYATSYVFEKLSEKIILFPLNTTHQLVIENKFLSKINTEIPSNILIKKILSFYLDRYLNKPNEYLPPNSKFSEPNFIKYPGAIIHDIIPLLCLVNPENFAYSYLPLSVIVEGKLSGATYVDHQAQTNIRIAHNILDPNKCLNQIINVLNSNNE